MRQNKRKNIPSGNFVPLREIDVAPDAYKEFVRRISSRTSYSSSSIQNLLRRPGHEPEGLWTESIEDMMKEEDALVHIILLHRKHMKLRQVYGDFEYPADLPENERERWMDEQLALSDRRIHFSGRVSKRTGYAIGSILTMIRQGVTWTTDVDEAMEDEERTVREFLAHRQKPAGSRSKPEVPFLELPGEKAPVKKDEAKPKAQTVEKEQPEQVSLILSPQDRIAHKKRELRQKIAMSKDEVIRLNARIAEHEKNLRFLEEHEAFVLDLFDGEA